MATVFIPKETVRRVAKDVRTIMKNPLHEHGIYYAHDDNDLLKGKALIIGPPNTPYEGGYFLFKFQFPTNYPHQPPVVTYCTNDGKTRFNPNLYRSGKVCLSVLNTWKGPQWTGCQTISSVLLALCASVLTDKPLLNEPGVDETFDDFNTYTEIIQYKTIEVAILDVVESEDKRNEFTTLHTIIREHFETNKSKVLKRVEEADQTTKMLQTRIYNMNFYISYAKLKHRINGMIKSG